MSFGLTNVPATFIDLMNKKFKSYLDLCVIVIDVILVYLRNEKDDSSDLRIVLHTLKDNELYAEFSKNEFWPNSMEFLGHIILDDGIRLIPKR